MNIPSQHAQTEVIQFEAKACILGEWLVVQLPESASKQLSSRGQVAVESAINGRELRQVLEPDGRWGHWFKIDQGLQARTGIRAGDVVSVEITPTKDWPKPTVPDDFSQALAAAEPVVQELWTRITPMARWEWVRWINETRNLETRQRRVEVSISKMQSGKRRPCCFNLAACTDPDLSKNGRLMEAE